MEQLSGLDSIFLTVEDERQHMHTACLGLYDPSTAPGGKVRFKQVLDFFSAKVDEIAFFRQRLVSVPLGLDRPFWVDTGGVDVEYHVRHISLPKPGDWRQLMIQVARIHSREIDRSRPLWEAYVIGGLDNIKGIKKGSFALYVKTHHAGIDGQAGAQLINSLHSLTPEIPPRSRAHIETDRTPSGLELGIRSLAHRGKQTLDIGQLAGDLGKAGLHLLVKNRAKLSADIKEGLGGLFTKDRGQQSGRAKNRFDQKVSPHRVVDAIALPFSGCKKIRAGVAGVTVNDIFLATSAGAVRRYLSAHGEITPQPLFTMMPIAVTGSQKDSSSANNVTSALVCMHTDIADPLERLLAIHKSAADSKQQIEDIGPDLLPRVSNLIPNLVLKAAMERTVQTKASLTVSNVRGPANDLYLAGAKCKMFVPVSIPTDGVGLNLTGFSYKEDLWVCATSCREMMPDPAFFMECLEDSFKELVQVAKKSTK